MDNYQVLRRIRLQPRHVQTTKNCGAITPPTSLIIASYPGDEGYYLIHLNEQQAELSDTYHETVKEAMDQAEWDFAVQTSEWQ